MSENRDLRGFTGAGYTIGRGRFAQVLWLVTQSLVFRPWWCPARLRTTLLRSFGAHVGSNVLVRHRVRVHWPWKLTIGDNAWIGEGAWLLNLEPIVIGRNAVVSQEAFLCTGSHDPRSPTFEFDNAPITVADGAWVAARAIVLRGVTVGKNAVVGAGTVVDRDVPEGQTVVAGRSTPGKP